MACGDEATLWSKEGVDPAHLAQCETCRAALARVQKTQALLGAAARVAPEVNWRKADDAVMGAVTDRLARRIRWRTPGLAVAGVFACALMAVVLWRPWASGPTLVATAIQVESAEGAHITQGTMGEAVLALGSEVLLDARIRTDAVGSAQVRLPEDSRARLSANSEAIVARASADEVEIKLARGSVVVAASHRPRKAFVVDADTVQVRVVGTAFRVVRTDGRVTVSVAEGRVLVEPTRGQSRILDAGQRVTIDGEGGWEELPLKEEDGDAFAAVGISLPAPEPEAVRAPAVAAAPAEKTPPRPAPNLRPSPSTRASSKPAPVPMTASKAPAAGEIASPPAPPAVAATAPAEEWKTPEFKDATGVAAQVPTLAERAKANGLPTSVEGLFLQRAQEALKSGQCGNYMVGLQDVVEGSDDLRARENARILRARCFEEQLKPSDAAGEYQKYLAQFPRGRFAAEARRALTE